MKKIQMIRALCGDPKNTNRTLEALLATVFLDNAPDGARDLELQDAVLRLVGVARGSGLLAGGAPDTLEVDGAPVSPTERVIYATAFLADRGTAAELPLGTTPDMARRAGIYNDFGEGRSTYIGLRERVENAVGRAENAVRWHRDVKAGAR
jgi:hypothetical protein